MADSRKTSSSGESQRETDLCINHLQHFEQHHPELDAKRLRYLCEDLGDHEYYEYDGAILVRNCELDQEDYPGASRECTHDPCWYTVHQFEDFKNGGLEVFDPRLEFTLYAFEQGEEFTFEALCGLLKVNPNDFDSAHGDMPEVVDWTDDLQIRIGDYEYTVLERPKKSSPRPEKVAKDNPEGKRLAVLRDDDAYFQEGDGHTEIHKNDEMIVIGNWGDVSSMIVIKLKPLAKSAAKA